MPDERSEPTPGLKPCPFCDEAPEMRDNFDADLQGTPVEPAYAEIRCRNRLCEVQPYITGDELETLASSWNRRLSRAVDLVVLQRIDDSEDAEYKTHIRFAAGECHTSHSGDVVVTVRGVADALGVKFDADNQPLRAAPMAVADWRADKAVNDAREVVRAAFRILYMEPDQHGNTGGALDILCDAVSRCGVSGTEHDCSKWENEWQRCAICHRDLRPDALAAPHPPQEEAR